jgi:membrane protease subunit (stomatin/prohibitin family)
MALWDGMRRQLRSVIEWEGASQDMLFTLWSANGDEIKNASKLIVRPGQGCIFLYEGKIQSVHLEEGLYELSTSNIPFITTLLKFMQAFESEHKVGIYFFWQTEFLNQKWGTPTPIKYDDPLYKFPVGLRAFGNFSFKITEPERFFVNVVGGRENYPVAEFKSTAVDRIIQPLTDLFAEAGLSYGEIDKNRNELATGLTTKLEPDFIALGFTMTDFRIGSTSFDQDTQTRIGKIADVSAEAMAAQRAGIDYAQLQQLGALRDAARNTGGAAGAGVGIGAGLGLGQAMAQSFNTPSATQQNQQTPAAVQLSVEERLEKLKSLFEKDLITEEEFSARKKEVLKEL